MNNPEAYVKLDKVSKIYKVGEVEIRAVDGAILIIVAVLFFGVRACIGSGKGTSKKEQNTVEDSCEML